MLENSYKNVKELFIECIDLEDDDRKVLLEKRCLNNKELYRQVTELLENDRKLASRNNPFPLNNTILDKCLFSSTQQTFGKYRILRLLGQGGMGSVFLGKRIDGEFEKLTEGYRGARPKIKTGPYPIRQSYQIFS
jgi:eukaryotic-like serine/threonine-protein kinase